MNLLLKQTSVFLLLAMVGASAPEARAEIPSECKAKPSDGRNQILKRERRATRDLPEDWNELAEDTTDWLTRGGGKFTLSSRVFDDFKKFEAAYPIAIFLDYDDTVYWNGAAIEFGCLRKLTERDGAKGVAITWHHLAARTLPYEAIWAVNDSGVTPTIVAWRPPTYVVRPSRGG